MDIKVYITSVTGSREIKSQQSEIARIMDSKSIKYNTIDISVDNTVREEMRNKCGIPTAIPPQVFNGDHYCGDYLQFMDAAENECLEQFLKLSG